MSDPLQIITAVLDSEGDARRVLAALDSAGYACVPREPTEEMLREGWAWAHDEDEGGTYRAMVAVAEGKSID